jgi:hypothetical protein
MLVLIVDQELEFVPGLLWIFPELEVVSYPTGAREAT